MILYSIVFYYLIYIYMYTENTPSTDNLSVQKRDFTKKVKAIGIAAITVILFFSVVSLMSNASAQDIDFEQNEFNRTHKLAARVVDDFGRVYCMDRIYDIEEKIRLYTRLQDEREVARLHDVKDAINTNCPKFALDALEKYFQVSPEQRTETVPTPSPVVDQVFVAEPTVDSTPTTVNLDALAKAVARHETASCTRGTGAKYNNCFGIKRNNTAPCQRISTGNFCIYSSPEESFEAFKVIWERWYGGLPNLEMARRYSGNDRAQTWLNNVTQFYYEYNTHG